MLTSSDFLPHTSQKILLDCFNQGAYQPLSNSLELPEQRIVVSFISRFAGAHEKPEIFIYLKIPDFHSHISPMLPG